MTPPINWNPQSESEQAQEIAKWLSFCLKMHDAGLEDQIPRNPFYKSRRGDLTDEYVNQLIKAIDDEFGRELFKNPDFHFRNNGTLTPPEFHRLGTLAKRALAEGLDKLLGFELA